MDQAIYHTGQITKDIGRCIYCGSEDSLTDEHVIPYALNGVIVLNRGSCKKCANIISRIERRVLRGPLSDYRYLKQFKSRSKYKEFVPTKNYTFQNKQGKLAQREMHLNEVGVYMFLPQFAEPKYFGGNPNDTGIEIKGIHKFSALPKKNNIKPDIDEVKITQDFPTELFLRFLCKIALGYVSLIYPREKYKSFITDFILGKKSGIQDWQYIGSPEKSTFSNNEIAIKVYLTKKVIWCEIKLFNDLPVTYKVVVGELI